MKNGINLGSHWNNQIQIVIRCWARDASRKMSENLPKVPASEVEEYLYNALGEMLVSFDETYNKAMNERIYQMERMLEEYQNLTPSKPFVVGGL